MLVIDASAALYAASARRGFDALRGLDLVAPPLLWSETTSAIHERLRREDLSVELARRVLGAIRSAPIAREMPDELYRRAFEVADGLGWAKTYDAEYVALADILECRLLTVDERLMRGAGLHVLQTRYFLYFPESLYRGTLASLENWLSWLPLGGQYGVFAQKTCKKK